MTKQTIIKKKSTGLLLTTAIVAGLAGFGLSETGFTEVAPAYADAVKVEGPAVFSFGDVVEAVSPAVVSVRVEANVHPASMEENLPENWRGNEFFERFFRNMPQGEFRRGGPRENGPRAQSQGSGFFVSADGYIVTNNHVIDGGSTFTVVMSDGTELDAKLVGTDPRTDLAVLKVEAEKDFTYVEFGDSRPRIGDWVVAVGNPFGLGGTVTAGIVSAHGRQIGASRYDDFIQIDAAVNKGNSGGPAFNLNGEVVGVNTAIFSPSGGNVGIAFAIPAGLANEIVTDLISDGSVTRGWLGVQIQPVTPEIAESLGLDEAAGTIVTSAQQGSPAQEAGLTAGDVITKVGDETVKGPRELARLIASHDPETEVTLSVWRDGETRDVAVKLGVLEQAAAVSPDRTDQPSHRSERLGRLGLELQGTDQGLVVTGIKPDSPAAERGLQVGDVISSVNGESINNTQDIKRILRDVQQTGRSSALLQVQRGEQTVFVPVPLSRG